MHYFGIECTTLKHIALTLSRYPKQCNLYTFKKNMYKSNPSNLNSMKLVHAENFFALHSSSSLDSKRIQTFNTEDTVCNMGALPMVKVRIFPR